MRDPRLRKIPLRVRKHAQTRVALLQALLQELRDKPLDAVAVRDLCDHAEVSEATFFNYFSRKTELLGYLRDVWALELVWWGRRVAEDQPGLKAVEAVYDKLAEQSQQHPGAMMEILALHAQSREKPEPADIPLAERLIAFPEHEGIEDVASGGVESVLVPNLEQAMQKKELPANTPLPLVMMSLAGIFYGVPMALLPAQAAHLPSAYRQQLSLLWSGLRAAARGGR